MKKVVAHLAEHTKEAFLLDPAAVKEGSTLATTVTGSDAGASLEKALTSLLAPAELTYVVREEAVVIMKRH